MQLILLGLWSLAFGMMASEYQIPAGVWVPMAFSAGAIVAWQRRG